MKHIGDYYIYDVQAVPFGEIKPAEMLMVVWDRDECKQSVQIIDHSESDFDENDDFAEADLLEILYDLQDEPVALDCSTGIYYIGFTAVDEFERARETAEGLHHLGWRTDTNNETNVDAYMAEHEHEYCNARAITAIMCTLELHEEQAALDGAQDEDEPEEDDDEEIKRDYNYLLDTLTARADKLATRILDLTECGKKWERKAFRYESDGNTRRMRECERKADEFYTMARMFKDAARVLGFCWCEDHFLFDV